MCIHFNFVLFGFTDFVGVSFRRSVFFPPRLRNTISRDTSLLKVRRRRVPRVYGPEIWNTHCAYIRKVIFQISQYRVIEPCTGCENLLLLSNLKPLCDVIHHCGRLELKWAKPRPEPNATCIYIVVVHIRLTVI